MKNLTKKRTLFFALFVLMGVPYTLHAAKSAYQPMIQLQKRNDATRLPSAKRKLLVHGYCRTYDVPKEVGLFIIYFVYGNPLQYKNKPLPNDLSGQDLSGFDFTGCAFTYTNLSYTDLTDVILTNTICDYQKAFLDNIKKNKIEGGYWYQNNLPQDLKSIAVVYPKLNNDTHKATLLHIASAFSQLPFYAGTKFYIKVQYWSCELLQLKQTLSDSYGCQLVCSLERKLNDDVNHFCWETEYPQDKVDIDTKKLPHANFAQYLETFNDGSVQYKCKAEDFSGLCLYKHNITENIKGLSKAYPKLKDKQLQQTACSIADALSKSYQIQKRALLYHYLFYQHQLIQLKNLVDTGAKNDIYYKFPSGLSRLLFAWGFII